MHAIMYDDKNAKQNAFIAVHTIIYTHNHIVIGCACFISRKEKGKKPKHIKSLIYARV